MTGLIWNNDTSMEPSAKLIPWLVYPGSFMQRLALQGINDARVHVLKQAWQFPTLEERQALGIKERKYALIREVIIKSDKDIWMFARTVFPLQTLTGKEKRFAHLKSRSLGSILFNDPWVTRSEFDFACLQQGNFLHKKIEECLNIKTMDTWGRRSIFYINNKPLLLQEFFMPSVERL